MAYEPPRKTKTLNTEKIAEINAGNTTHLSTESDQAYRVTLTRPWDRLRRMLVGQAARLATRSNVSAKQ
jgi:hypothetical protein